MLKMILWEQYNALGDGDTRRMSRLLLDGIGLDDPRLGQYRKELDRVLPRRSGSIK